MAVSPKHEQAAIREAQRDHTACILMPPHLYTRPDGALSVYRDGLQEFLHRRLYRLLRDPKLGRERIARTCRTHGCVNPWHYRATGDRIKGAPGQCVNGHEYTPENTTGSGHCRVCAERRQAARAVRLRPTGGELNAAKTHCPQGHDYGVPENVYRYRSEAGWHRKCRVCAKQRAAARRAAA